MAFQYKTLIRLAPAALLIVAFQNCAPQKFSQTNAASEKSFIDDGSVDPVLPPPVVSDLPADDGTTPGRTTDHHQHDENCDHEKHTNRDQPKSPSEQRAANCKDLRAKFEAMKVKPAAMSKIESRGASVAGPFYVSGVDLIDARGASDVYVVAADRNAMAKDVHAVGAGHVVLCGVHAGNVEAKGASAVDVIGANVLGSSKENGAAKISIIDQDGNPI
jgi:hypothetical protein